MRTITVIKYNFYGKMNYIEYLVIFEDNLSKYVRSQFLK